MFGVDNIDNIGVWGCESSKFVSAQEKILNSSITRIVISSGDAIASGINAIGNDIKLSANALKFAAEAFTGTVDTVLDARSIASDVVENISVKGAAKAVGKAGLNVMYWSLGLNNYLNALINLSDAFSLISRPVPSHTEIIKELENQIEELEGLEQSLIASRTNEDLTELEDDLNQVQQQLEKLNKDYQIVISHRLQRIEEAKAEKVKLQHEIDRTEEKLSKIQSTLDFDPPTEKEWKKRQKLDVKREQLNEELQNLNIELENVKHVLKLLPQTLSEHMDDVGRNLGIGLAKNAVVGVEVAAYASGTIDPFLNVNISDAVAGATSVVAQGVNASVTFGINKAYDLGSSVIAIASNPLGFAAGGAQTALYAAVAGGTTTCAYKSAKSYIAACESETWTGAIMNMGSSMLWGAGAIAVPAAFILA